MGLTAAPLEPGDLWRYITGTAASFAALVMAYTTGLRILRLLRLHDLTLAYGKRTPEPLQWHMVWGLATGALFLVGELTVMSWGAGGWISPLTLAFTALAVVSGLGRTFMGGSGRLHMIAIILAAPIYLARLASFVAMVLASLR